MTNTSCLDSVHNKIMRFHLKYLLIYSVIIQSACEIHPFPAILNEIYIYKNLHATYFLTRLYLKTNLLKKQFLNRSVLTLDLADVCVLNFLDVSFTFGRN